MIPAYIYLYRAYHCMKKHQQCFVVQDKNEPNREKMVIEGFLQVFVYLLYLHHIIYIQISLLLSFVVLSECLIAFLTDQLQLLHPFSVEAWGVSLRCSYEPLVGTQLAKSSQ